jgi:tetratricopeptide (TPR) repeat protein
VHELAEIQREQNDPICADGYLEALKLAETVGDNNAQASCAYNLSRVYINIAKLRNVEKAERWAQKYLDSISATDSVRRSRGIGQLGRIAQERFKDAIAAKRPAEELTNHLERAIDLYEQDLALTPPNSIKSRGIAHNQLGNLYFAAGDTDRALYHYQQDVRYCEQGQDIYGAGQTRRNVAVALFNVGRLSEARAYAEAALINFRAFDQHAAADIAKTEELTSLIEVSSKN